MFHRLPFSKPLDLCECQQYYPPTPVPYPVWRLGQSTQIKSQDAKVSVMLLATKKPRHWRKTLGPIDGLTRQISGPTMGQRLKVSGRQKSFCHDKPGMLNADELVGKGLTTWDIPSVSHQQHALFTERNQFRTVGSVRLLLFSYILWLYLYSNKVFIWKPNAVAFHNWFRRFTGLLP